MTKEEYLKIVEKFASDLKKERGTVITTEWILKNIMRMLIIRERKRFTRFQKEEDVDKLIDAIIEQMAPLFPPDQLKMQTICEIFHVVYS